MKKQVEKTIENIEKVFLDEYLNANQLAKGLHVRPGTIYSWLSRGVDIPSVKIEGTVRFRRKAVEEWLLKKEEERKRKNFEI